MNKVNLFENNIHHFKLKRDADRQSKERTREKKRGERGV